MYHSSQITRATTPVAVAVRAAGTPAGAAAAAAAAAAALAALGAPPRRRQRRRARARRAPLRPRVSRGAWTRGRARQRAAIAAAAP